MKILRSLTLIALCFILLQGYSYAVFQPYFQLPSQTGQNGKVLGTNGTSPSWVANGTNTFGTPGVNNPSALNISEGVGGAPDFFQLGGDASQSCQGITGSASAGSDIDNVGTYFTINASSGRTGFCAPISAGGGYFLAADSNNFANPWHPATAPSCVVAPGGGGCVSSDITMPLSTLVCIGNEQGDPTGTVDKVYTSPPGPTETIGVRLGSVWVAGGTITFNMSCT